MLASREQAVYSSANGGARRGFDQIARQGLWEDTMGARWARNLAVLVLAVWLLAIVSTARAQAPEETTLAVPALSLTFSSTFVAEELGLWDKEGLRVKITTVAGVGSTNAVLAGSVDFSPAGAATLVRASARGQNLLAILQLMDRIPQEAVLRKDVAEKAGITPGMPIEKRAQALRGKRMAVDSVNAINHLLLKYLAKKGGLDPEKDLIVTPMQPPNMIAALKSGAIDGFLMSPPWPVMATRDGIAVTLMSIPRGDLAELSPFSFILLLTRPGFCDAKPSVCRKMVAGYKRALALIHDHPAEAVAALRKKFDKIDPAVLADSFEVTRAAASRTGLVQEAGIKRAVDFQVDAGVMKAEEKVPPLPSLYTNKFVQ
jgi:ABC-type nitrate/sulfonate/bicarbonate transport system substrate-binding protein